MDITNIKHPDVSHNNQLASIFHRIGSCYRYLGSKYRLNVMAYDAASHILHGMNDDIATYANKDATELKKIKGFDENVGEKILEYLNTGKIKTLEKLKKQVPFDLLELMDINGFGPASIKNIHEKLHVNTCDEMVAAIKAGKLQTLGFSSNKIENMKRGLKLFKEIHTRLALCDAVCIGDEVLKQVLALPGVKRATIAGSLRRKKETIADIDIVAVAENIDWSTTIEQFIFLPFIRRVLASSKTRASVLLKKNNMQVDVRLVHDHEYGAALLYFTGSRECNIALKTLARTKGWLLDEYGVFDTETGKWLAGETEDDIFRLLGLQYIPPELREERDISEKAGKQLPKLVEERDIRGDMQIHSIWSDGIEDIETIARFVLKVYPHYEYIVITDHLPAKGQVGGLQLTDFNNQFAEIDAVNKMLNRQFVKKGVEVDILPDGSLDLPDDLLQQFEWVTASIHTGYNVEYTNRLLKACENPYVNCIDHPSGRLIGKREASTVDWEKLIEKAAVTGTCIAINAQPDRLDLKGELVKAAIEKRVKISINTDAHDLNQFDFMAIGVAVARRGWCTKENVLNTGSWKDVEYYKKYKQSVIKIKENHEGC